MRLLLEKAKFTKHQIINVIIKNEQNRSFEKISSKILIIELLSMDVAGIQANHLKRLMEVEDVNQKLQQMYAKLSLDPVILKVILSKNGREVCSG